MILFAEKSCDHPIFEVKWIPSQAKFCCVGHKPNGQGLIEIFALQENSPALMHTINVKDAVRCLTFDTSGAQPHHLAVGDFTGKLTVM